jgi:hypothetical protein
LISAHQNNLKTQKNINLKQRKKIKKIQIFLKALLKHKKRRSLYRFWIMTNLPLFFLVRWRKEKQIELDFLIENFNLVIVFLNLFYN